MNEHEPMTATPAQDVAEIPDVALRLQELRRRVARELNDMNSSLTRIRMDLHEALDWRAWSGQRYAETVPRFHRERCQATHDAGTAMSKILESTYRQAESLLALLDAHVSLELAAELIADKAYAEPMTPDAR
jgi:hypothetical protein